MRSALVTCDERTWTSEGVNTQIKETLLSPPLYHFRGDEALAACPARWGVVQHIQHLQTVVNPKQALSHVIFNL